MDITVKDTDGPLTAIVKFEDIHGHETNPDDVPQWASSAPEVASVTASEDGKTAIVSDYNPGDGVSAATVISCDSTNLAGDVLHFTGTVTVEAGDAVSGDIEFQPFA